MNLLHCRRAEGGESDEFAKSFGWKDDPGKLRFDGN